MKHICFIIHKYATPVTPYTASFIRALAWSMRDNGVKITIISPLPVNLFPAYIKVPYYVEEKTSKGNVIPVYYPKTIEFGQSKKILGHSLVHQTTFFMEKAARKVLISLKEKPDVLYGHFLAPSGIVCARLGKEFNIPAFFACGESHDTIGQFGASRARKECENIKGVIAVSSFLKNYLLDNNIVSEDKIIVLPNGFDEKRFKNIDKEAARKQFNIPKHDIVVSFVGAFNGRKGVLRLCEAMKSIDNAKFVCIGQGKQKPYGHNLLFAKTLLHKEIPTLLHASDIFVLPTQAEGCSNAIVEAIACGLPVISSDLSFNNELLDESNSIRIDPNNVEELVNAIKTLVDNKEERLKMSAASYVKSKCLTLSERTNRILDFIQLNI